MCTFRDRCRVEGKEKGVSLGLIAAWDWWRVGADAVVATAVVVFGVGGPCGLLRTDSALSDMFFMSSLSSFYACKRWRWGLVLCFGPVCCCWPVPGCCAWVSCLGVKPSPHSRQGVGRGIHWYRLLPGLLLLCLLAGLSRVEPAHARPGPARSIYGPTR